MDPDHATPRLSGVTDLLELLVFSVGYEHRLFAIASDTHSHYLGRRLFRRD
jgi:hypothetical protein